MARTKEFSQSRPAKLVQSARLRHFKMPLPISITDVPLGNDILRIELVELHGHPNFSARKFFRNDDGQWQPGAMGLAFYIQSLPDIVAAFEDALSRAREERLLP